MEAEEKDLKEQIDLIIVSAINRNKNYTMTQDEIRDYIKLCFDNRSLEATIENDEDGFAIVYGIYDKTIIYLTSDLINLQEEGAIIGSTDDWDYEVNLATQKAVLIKYNAATLGTSITIPNIIDGYLIAGLGDQVFMNRKELEEVYFSEGLRSIGAKAFSNCSNLKVIGNFPKTLRYIGEEAFFCCSKLTTNIEFSNNIKSVGARAFYNCTKITGTVENLIRTNVTYGQYAFYGCTSLTGDIGELLSNILAKDATEIPDYLFSGMSKLTGTITIGSNIKTIGVGAFEGCTNVEALDITNATSLETIGANAFYKCTNMVGEIKFVSQITTIGTGAFYSCDKLTYIEIPSSVTSVGPSAFASCDSVTKLLLNCGDCFYTNWGYEYTFNSMSSLTTIEFGSNCTMTRIQERIFMKCNSLESITLPDTIKLIGSYAFSECANLKTVVYPSKLESIGSAAFAECSLLESLPVVYSNTTKKDELISTLTTISSSAFLNCTNLGKSSNGKVDLISLLESSIVTTIGDSAFNGCIYLTGNYGENLSSSAVDKNGNKITIALGLKAFEGTSITRTLEYKLKDNNKISEDEFKNVSTFTDSLGNIITEIEIPSTVTTIGKNAFADCTSITKVIIPSTVTSIGINAFSGCTSLNEVVYNAEYYELPESIFANCTSLTSITNMNKITKINSSAFENCSSLESFDFGSSLTAINSKAFEGAGLISITLPSSITNFSTTVFYNCEKLETAYLTNCSFTTLPDSTFYNCTSLSTVELSNNFTSIGNSTFKYCKGLKSLTVPDSVTTLGGTCFEGSGLENLYGCNNVTTIGSEMFIHCDNLVTVSGMSKVTEIPSNVFNGCYSLTTVGFNWSILKKIGSQAFSSCVSLYNTTDPKNPTKIIDLPKGCSLASNAFEFTGLTVNVAY